jgi:hypothetical protein
VRQNQQAAERAQLQLELLEIGRLMTYQALVLGSEIPENAIFIRPGLQAWTTYGASIDTIPRIRQVIAAARRYYGILKEVGLITEEPDPQPPK